MKVKCSHVRLFLLEKNNLLEFHKFIIINLETEHGLKTEYYQMLHDWCFFFFKRLLEDFTKSDCVIFNYISFLGSSIIYFSVSESVIILRTVTGAITYLRCNSKRMQISHYGGFYQSDCVIFNYIILFLGSWIIYFSISESVISLGTVTGAITCLRCNQKLMQISHYAPD